MPTTFPQAVPEIPVRAIADLGGADVAVALAVTPTAFEQAFASLRRGGRLICVALPPETQGVMRLPIAESRSPNSRCADPAAQEPAQTPA